MKNFIFIFISLLFLVVSLLVSCSSQLPVKQGDGAVRLEDTTARESKVTAHFRKFDTRTGNSISGGTVSNGSLKNGYLLPFSGSNYHYFDTTSYLMNRGFMNLKVRNTLLSTYEKLVTATPAINYGVMECSSEHGGKLMPHRTHQNGLSVDFMTPLLKNGVSFTELDYIGAEHYFLDFDSEGKWTKDASVSIDFETMAKHLLTVNAQAAENGLKIEKIIWKMELQDELFSTPSGKKLKATGIYVTKKLDPLINSLHDDHYHVDFREK